MRKFIDILNEANTPTVHQGDREILKHEAGDNPPQTTETLPAEKNGFAPQWYRMNDLPPHYKMAMEMVGPSIFPIFTATNIQNIEMMIDALNGEEDVKEMARRIVSAGHNEDLLQVVAVDLPPALARADCSLYRVQQTHYLFVRDAGGHYIYSWPCDDTVIGGQGALGASPTPRQISF
jgi:hypothetical protein